MGLSADYILREMQSVFERRGVKVVLRPEMTLREINFRSLDFSELALRLEDKLGKELTFRADALRRIEKVQDVVAFFLAADGK